MLRRLVRYFDFETIGILEILYALYPIMSSYQIGSIPMDFLWIIILDIFALRISYSYFRVNIMYFLFSLVLLHEFVLYLANGLDSSHFNNILSIGLMLVSIFIIAPALNLNKMKGAINLIAILSCFGIFYHAVMILSGNTVSPIPIPFLPAPNTESRIFQESIRPLSFFVEPGAFAGFMMMPLFLALSNKKWVLVAFYVFSILLSTSTNGIVMTPILIVLFILLGKVSLKAKLVPIILIISMSFVFLNSPLFESGIKKIEDTDTGTNQRLSNGPSFVQRLPTEYLIWGMPVRNADEYIEKGYYGGGDPRVGNETLYMSDFWNIISIYGIIVLIVHIMVYLYFIKKDISLVPYMGILFVALFTTRRAYGCSYAIDMIFLLMWLNNNGKKVKLIRIKK